MRRIKGVKEVFYIVFSAFPAVKINKRNGQKAVILDFTDRQGKEKQPQCKYSYAIKLVILIKACKERKDTSEKAIIKVEFFRNNICENKCQYKTQQLGAASVILRL